MIYKETVKPIKESTGGSMMLTSVIVISLVVIVGLCNFIYNRFGIPYINYGAFILYVLIGIYIYRNKIRGYRYSIIDNELIFEQVVGSKIKPIVNLKLSQVKYFCPLSRENKSNIKYDHNYLLLHKRNSLNAYVIYAKQGAKTIRIVFEPSEKLVELIGKA